MLLRQLEYFCAIAKERSFTKAADACYVSQSAISQQIKALEADLEVSLIERRGRSFRLTPAGEHLYRRAAAILDDLQNLRRELADIDNDFTTLRLGYLNRYVGREVQAAVAAFARRHPYITVSAEPSSHDGLYSGVLRGDYHLIVNDRRRELSGEFENRPLFTGFDYIEVSEASPLAACDSVAVEDLANTACILVAPPDQREVETEYHARILNFKGDFLFADTLEQGHMMVAANQGFLLIEARNETGRTGGVLTRIPLVDGTGAHRRHDYYAFWLRSRTTPYLQEFSTILKSLFSSPLA